MFPVHAITQIPVKGGRQEEQIISLRDSVLMYNQSNIFLGRVSMLIWHLANGQRDDADGLSLKKQTNKQQLGVDKSSIKQF